MLELGDFGIAADASDERKRNLTGIVVDPEHDREAPLVEAHRVSGVAVNLVFDGGDRCAVDSYRGRLTAADAHLLELAGIRPHHRG